MKESQRNSINCNGVSFIFVTVLSTVAVNYGYPAVIGAVICGGIFEGTLGFFAKYLPWMEYCVKGPLKAIVGSGGINCWIRLIGRFSCMAGVGKMLNETEILRFQSHFLLKRERVLSIKTSFTKR